MSFSKQHFELTAQLIKAQRPQLPEDIFCSGYVNQRLDALADDFADAFESHNGLFDRTRFLKACEVTT